MPSTLEIWWHRNRTAIYIIPAVGFLIAAAILDRYYVAVDWQIPLIVTLIVGVFAGIILSIPAIAYFARGDNYLEMHVPQRDEPIDLPFHGGKYTEELLYPPEIPLGEEEKYVQKVARGEAVPRYDLALNLTEAKDFSDLFPELKELGIPEVTIVHIRYHLKFSQRFDLSTGAIVVRKGVPLYHPHAEEVFAFPAGVDYYEGVPYPVFDIKFSRKGDHEMLNSPLVMDLALMAWVLISRGMEEDKLKQKAEAMFEEAIKSYAAAQATRAPGARST